MLDCLNYCIMYAKVFISECKYNEKECDFYEYQKILKNVLDGEIVSYRERGQTDMFNTTLGLVYNNL